LLAAVELLYLTTVDLPVRAAVAWVVVAVAAVAAVAVAQLVTKIKG